MSTDPDDERALPTNAEDAKRFKAMEAIESTSDDQNPTNATSTDSEALGKAMATLSGPVVKPAASMVKALKVSQEDVALIVEEMEVSKVKATELLRAHGGNVVDTLKAMVAV